MLKFSEERVLTALQRARAEDSDPASWLGQATDDLTHGRLTPAVLDALERYLDLRQPEGILLDAAVRRHVNRVLAQHGRLALAPPSGAARRRTGQQIVTYEGARYLGK